MSVTSWLALSVILGGCGAPKRITPPTDRVGADLARVLDSVFAMTPQSPGMILRVEAPSIGLTWFRAVGVLERISKTPLAHDNTVRIASMTKTYVAAAILRLAENGKVGLDSSIARYLLPVSVTTLRHGGYDPAKITVRMLLQHTSGLFDYALSPEYSVKVFKDIGHRWTRLEQLRFAMDHGKPHGPPDSSYHYGDTGYILLGEILETVTGASMEKAVHDLIGFEKLGIRYTYFETLEPVPPGTPARAHQYWDDTDLYPLEASTDLYGGGGLVSNGEDVIRFYRALVRGDIFSKKETVAPMLAVSAQSIKAGEGDGYGMGVERYDVTGIPCYGHGGYWGTAGRHCPSIDVTVFAATNFAANSLTPELTKAAIAVVLRALPAAK